VARASRGRIGFAVGAMGCEIGDPVKPPFEIYSMLKCPFAVCPSWTDDRALRCGAATRHAAKELRCS